MVKLGLLAGATALELPLTKRIAWDSPATYSAVVHTTVPPAHRTTTIDTRTALPSAIYDNACGAGYGLNGSMQIGFLPGNGVPGSRCRHMTMAASLRLSGKWS